jgi:hypothetical protein
VKLWPTSPFGRGVAIFFALVLLTTIVLIIVSAPLAFDGAYFLFRILDERQLVVEHRRLIDVVVQLPVLAALRLSRGIELPALTFSTALASTSIAGLAISWLVCRRRRPSLFLWPALSICIVTLPGLFFFQNEQLMVVTLLWPAFLVSLIGASPAVLTLVALTSVVAMASHPITAVLLGFTAIAALATATLRPAARRFSLGFAGYMVLLVLIRVAIPLDQYERDSLSMQIVDDSFNHAVWGWPLVALTLSIASAPGFIVSERRRSAAYHLAPMVLAGAALIAWAIDRNNWKTCLDYRYWVAPFSMILMAAAAIDELLPRGPAECERQARRRYALPLIGATFLVVLTIQSAEWKTMSDQLRSEMVNSDQGCLQRSALYYWLQDTPLNHWGTPLYAVELQGRKPATLLLPRPFACHVFASYGVAALVDQGSFTYLKQRAQGWFDFDDAYRRTKWHHGLN